MAKRCKHEFNGERCKNNVFAYSYCAIHQASRTDDRFLKQQTAKSEKKQAKIEKAKAEPKKRRVRIPVGTRHTQAEMIRSTRENGMEEVYGNQVDIFREKWANEDHVSFLSGRPILITEGTDLWFSIWAHVLSKAQNKYPAYKLFAKDIVMLLPEEHTLWDCGTMAQRAKYADKYNCSWNKMFSLSEELKENYPNYY